MRRDSSLSSLYDAMHSCSLPSFNPPLISSPMTQFVDAYTLGWGQSPFTKSLNARATSTRAMAGAPSTAGAGKK